MYYKNGMFYPVSNMREQYRNRKLIYWAWLDWVVQ